MPFANRAAAVALAGGLFFAFLVPAFSQSQDGEQKPAAPQTAEEKAKEEKAKEARAKAAREFAEAAKLPKNAGLPECLWTGRLAASLLYRNDVDTTKRYMDLYDRFGCPADHLKLAIRCVVRLWPRQGAEMLADRVQACWVNPDTPPPSLVQ
jgi:hypothetical protein